MLLQSFETVAAVCPVCLAQGPAPLRIAIREVEAAGHLLHGVLHCTRETCMHEFPVIDGVPFVLPDVRQYLSKHLQLVTARDDLAASLESILADCAGPGGPFDAARQQQSTYGRSHYGDGTQMPTGNGSIFGLLDACIEMAGDVHGPVLEIGCGAGGVARELARRLEQTVTGIELNFPLLKIAATAAREHRVRFPLRRTGVVYDRVEFDLPPQVVEPTYWLADATAAPFGENAFQTIVALNVLDSTPSPWELLRAASRLLAPGGKLLLTCPYDWSSGATPLESWIGGHSQRGPHRGDGPTVLRELLQAWRQEQPHAAMQIIAEQDNVPWKLQIHDRSQIEYRTHCMVLQHAAF